MTNEHNQVVCDMTSTILRDDKCLFPGYIEVTNGQFVRYYSDDPQNQDFTTPGILKNRVEYQRIEGPMTAPEGTPDGHYMDMDMMFKASILHRSEQLNAITDDICPVCGARTNSELHQQHLNQMQMEQAEQPNPEPRPEAPESILPDQEPIENPDEGVINPQYVEPVAEDVTVIDPTAPITHESTESFAQENNPVEIPNVEITPDQTQPDSPTPTETMMTTEVAPADNPVGNTEQEHIEDPLPASPAPAPEPTLDVVSQTWGKPLDENADGTTEPQG